MRRGLLALDGGRSEPLVPQGDGARAVRPCGRQHGRAAAGVASLYELPRAPSDLSQSHTTLPPISHDPVHLTTSRLPSPHSLHAPPQIARDEGYDDLSRSLEYVPHDEGERRVSTPGTTRPVSRSTDSNEGMLEGLARRNLAALSFRQRGAGRLGATSRRSHERTHTNERLNEEMTRDI